MALEKNVLEAALELEHHACKRAPNRDMTWRPLKQKSSRKKKKEKKTEKEALEHKNREVQGGGREWAVLAHKAA